MTQGLLCEFTGVDTFMPAYRHLQRLGYVRLEAFTPYPVPGLDQATDSHRRLGTVVLCVSLASALGAYAIQWWTGMDFPLLVGSMPAHPWPAYIPITFESAILGGALAALIAGAWCSGLPRWWDEVFLVDGFDRATSDRFFLLINARDPHFEASSARQALAEFAPVRMVQVGDGHES